MTRALIMALGAVAVSVMSASAAVEFVPPNDPNGFVASSGEAYVIGRGIGFTVSADITINSVGVFHDLSNVALSFSIHEIDKSAADPFAFERGPALRSGSGTVNTSGLEWIDFVFEDLPLNSGAIYLIEFMHTGPANQNFFYDNKNELWSQNGFQGLDGTAGNSFRNGLVAAFRVDTPAVVPLPAGLPLLASALALLTLVRGRRRAAKCVCLCFTDVVKSEVVSPSLSPRAHPAIAG